MMEDLDEDPDSDEGSAANGDAEMLDLVRQPATAERLPASLQVWKKQ